MDSERMKLYKSLIINARIELYKSLIHTKVNLPITDHILAKQYIVNTIFKLALLSFKER